MLPLLAAMVILAVSGAAIAVDLARAHALRQQLQLTADAAALAAAVNLPDVEAARNAAYRYAQRNMPGYLDVITADDIAFGQWDSEARRVSASEAAPSAVRVTPSLTAEKGNAIATLFAGVLGHGLLDVSASAVAGKRSPMCILALEPDKSAALALDVLAEIEAPNCTVQVNSRHQIAFRMLATSRFQAEGLCVTGGAQTSLLGSVTPEPTTGCPPQPDPLADLEAPEIEDCDFTDTDLDGHHGTLQPGVYCGGLVVGGSSDVQLAAGLYVIKDGPLKISDSSKITGDGVTFFLTGKKAVIDFEDESELSLTAPAEGALAGILVFQDRDFGGEHVWDSKAPTSLFGTIYLPEGSLISESSNAITPVNSCNVLITKSLRFKFQSAVSIDLSQEHCRDYLPGAVLGTVALLD
ncbi:MAG: pilus assembly protein TadG-related protein [Alphaproteobacteria bacterium]